ncbi:helix-turn-helix domain-containing protein [Ensifer aridi]|uniref:helix-turn-helix domain-containing protein n=1 Tax=Ensifer aridi TaxID=1708715 RepID=UPI00358DE843
MNGHYEPGNCRWATVTEQMRNKRSTLMLTIDGVAKPIVEWAEIFGVDYALVDDRRRKGWSSLDALTTPVLAPDEKTVHHGEDNGNARLTSADVVEIKGLLAAGLSQRKIARRFRVSQKTIYLIHHGKTWLHHRDAEAS